MRGGGPIYYQPITLPFVFLHLRNANLATPSFSSSCALFFTTGATQLFWNQLVAHSFRRHGRVHPSGSLPVRYFLILASLLRYFELPTPLPQPMDGPYTKIFQSLDQNAELAHLRPTDLCHPAEQRLH